MKTVKNLIPALVAVALLLPLSANATSSTEVRQAMQTAAERAEASLRAANIPPQATISVLPLANDPGRYFEGLLKMAVTRAGLTYVEGREDPFWDAVMAEVEWDERKMDMLDERTLTTFGKLKSTQFLLYGNIREARQTERGVYVEVELHLSSIETKQHLWGDLIAVRYYMPGQITGMVDLDPALRQLLRQSLQAEVASIRQAEKLQGVQRVVMAPIAGDIDGYIGGLVENFLSQTTLFPTRLDANTLGEVRQILRDRPQTADAVMTGAVRDLSRTLRRQEPGRSIYETIIELQLRIESASDGSVLWSQTVSAIGEDIDEESWWSLILKNRTALVAAGVILVGLFVFILLLRAMTRSR